MIAHLPNEPVAGRSDMQRYASDFSVETIRPLPKAPPRAKTSAIFTDHFHLQPLVVRIYGPLKNYMNKVLTSWMSSNPGKRNLYMISLALLRKRYR